MDTMMICDCIAPCVKKTATCQPCLNVTCTNCNDVVIVGIICALRFFERYENRMSAKREREKREIERERAQQKKQRRTQNEQVKDQKQMDNQNPDYSI